MGFDLHGENPIIKEGTVRPEEIDWNTATDKEKEAYWDLQQKFREANPGEYFRANVWFWRPIWNFVCEMCPDILTQDDFEKGHFNDNHLIEADRAKEIAQRLREKMDIARKRQEKFDAEAPNKEKFNNMLEDAARHLYEKISKPKSEFITCPGDMQTHDPENYARWETLMHNDKIQFDEMSYPINAKAIEKFAEFAEHSGGFRIN